MTKMTKREALAIAMNALNHFDSDAHTAAWEVLRKEADRLDRAALRAKTTETKADREKAEFRQTVMELVADNGNAMRASDVAKALDVSVQKASAALNTLAKEGSLARVEGEKHTVLFAIVG